MAIEPVTREERFLAAAGGRSVTPPTPITRKEQLLQGIIDAVKSGGVTPDVIEGAVNDYLNANPVQPGATTEQAAQIEQNKTDIADLQTEIGDKQPKGDYVKTVNGNKPDSNGNVVVATGGNGSGQNPDLSGYAKEAWVQEGFQPKGDYALASAVPTKVSQLQNDSKYLTAMTAAMITAALGYTPINPGLATLARHTDGLLYLFVNGKPVGSGVELPTGGIDGYITEDKQIIFNNLPDGEYSLAYLKADGTISAPIGSMVKDTNVYYTITNTLTNCTNSNSATKVTQGSAYSATITAKSGYELKSVTATMGGSAVTVSGGKINITNVTGNIVITAVAGEIKVNYTNLADPASADWLENTRISSSGFPSQDGITTSNWIAVTKGDVLRIKGIDVNTPQSARVALFGSTKNLLSSAKVSGLTSADATGVIYDTTGAQFTIASTNAKFIRICGELKGAASDVIITKNEPIE